MEVIRGLENLKKDFRNLVLTLGSFDGMHLGHQKVIERVISRAREIKGRSMVITFHPHPRRIVNNRDYPPLLTAGEQKLKLIDCLGVDACLIINFNKNFSRMSPQEFVVNVLHQRLHVKEIFVGSDYLFGKGKSGNMCFLSRVGREYDFQVNKVSSVRRKREVVSSTRIRQLIQKGELSQAKELLGRPYSISGKVKRGNKKSSLIGYPTANLGPCKEVLPLEGAYAAWMQLDKEVHAGVVGIIERNKKKIVEAHLFNFNGDLYGSKMEVIFWKRIRGKKCFSHRGEAKKQITKDKEIVQKLIPKFPFTKF
ncbi:bifunctional riboflavin kinase/FAD synthetase [candidate division NPL-UPA2 bacterium]|nr:bifunctional riboflavin kinase/FAD synthetase [candidate division NPL-UPA2 bacterium]